jgi:Flp pilus assembly protein TadD/4-amino-4-deoxy-L-arabinose transferase-like glycosyltransferase
LTQPDAGLDTTVYTTLASQVAAGNLALGPGLYFVSPLYIYFLALVLGVAKTFAAARFVQIALGTAAVALVFATAQRWFGSRAAWIAAILAALTGLFTFHEVLLLQASLDPFLTAAALCALAWALTSGPSGRWFAIAGALFGLQTMNRPNVLVPAVVVIGILVIGRRWRSALWVAAGIAAALTPLAIRNYAVAGDWSPMSSHGGLNFYIGNNPDADGTYHLVPGITPAISGQRDDARKVAEAAVGRHLDDGEVSSYFYGLGWHWIRANPRDAAVLLLRKIAYALNAAYIPLNYSYAFYAYDERTLLAALVVGPWLLIPMGIFGLIVGASARSRFEYWTWVSFVPAFVVAVAGFFVTERYRLPLLVPLCVGAGAAIDWIWRVLSSHRRREPSDGRTRPGFVRVVLAVAALMGSAVVAEWRFGLDDGRTEERTRMAEAMVLRDRYDEAEAWTKKAEERHPQPALLHFRIGRLLIERHKADAAVAHLRHAQQLDPHQPAIAYALGQALVDAGHPDQAIPYLRTALAAGVRVDLAGFDLARALASTGDRAGALQILQTVTPAKPDDAESWDVLGQLALQLESPSLAGSLFSRAVAAAPRAAKPRQDLGLALAMEGRYEDAIRNFQTAILLDPSDPGAHLNLAVAYAQTGRVNDARVHAQEALRLQPNYARARAFLGALDARK